MSDKTALFVKMATDSWNSYLKRTDALFNELSDEQLQKQISHGRNRGIYLLGHLTAVNDRLLPMFGFGDQLHPHLVEAFLTNPDDATKSTASIAELRACWKQVNEKLSAHINALSQEDWFQKHSSVSAEDFAKEPHRNRLNVLMSRTSHMAEHLGQLLYLRAK